MTPEILRIYIAGPYTSGDVAMNVRQAVLAGLAIHETGHAPFIPHLFHFAHYLCPQEYAVWCALDLQWLKACHAVLRLPGESPGSDREVEFAMTLGLPIYHGLEACLQALPIISSRGVQV